MPESKGVTERLTHRANLFYYTTVVANISLTVTLLFFVCALTLVMLGHFHPNEISDARFNSATGVFPIYSPYVARTYAIFGFISFIPTAILRIVVVLIRRHLADDLQQAD